MKVVNMRDYKLAKKHAEHLPVVLDAIYAFRDEVAEFYRYDEVSSILGVMWDVETYLQIKLYKATKILNEAKEKK